MAPYERGMTFRLEVYEGAGISLVEVYKRVEKSVISVVLRSFLHKVVYSVEI